MDGIAATAIACAPHAIAVNEYLNNQFWKFLYTNTSFNKNQRLRDRSHDRF